MNREEILSKSRKENKSRDFYNEEINLRAATISSVAAVILATILFLAEFALCHRWNFGLYALIFSVGAATHITKYVSLRQKKQLLIAAFYTAVTLTFAVIHIYGLWQEASI